MSEQPPNSWEQGPQGGAQPPQQPGQPPQQPGQPGPPFQQPGQPPAQAPGQQPWQSAAPGPGGPGYPGGPGGPAGGGPEGPEGTGPGKGLWIALGAALLLVVAAVVVLVVVLTSDDDDDDTRGSDDNSETAAPTEQPTEEPTSEPTESEPTAEPPTAAPPTETGGDDEPTGPVAFVFPPSVDGKTFVPEESVANGEASSVEYRSIGHYAGNSPVDFAMYQYFPSHDLEEYSRVQGPDGLVDSTQVDDALCYPSNFDDAISVCAIAFKGGVVLLSGNEDSLDSAQKVVDSLHALVAAVD